MPAFEARAVEECTGIVNRSAIALCLYEVCDHTISMSGTFLAVLS